MVVTCTVHCTTSILTFAVLCVYVLCYAHVLCILTELWAKPPAPFADEEIGDLPLTTAATSTNGSGASAVVAPSDTELMGARGDSQSASSYNSSEQDDDDISSSSSCSSGSNSSSSSPRHDEQLQHEHVRAAPRMALV
jgi:hypothetical protein